MSAKVFWLLILTALSTPSIAAISYDTNIRAPIGVHLNPPKTTADRIREHGYPAESHYLETSDNYVLNIFRIPYSHKLRNQNVRRPVVLIQHGFLGCSDFFIINGPDNSIAYNFADAGFDVWLGNARGNTYSRNNTKITKNYFRFWDFSWHEIGAIDMPAMIDYILKETGEASLHFLGHSQGGTVYFVMCSTRPEYNTKIRTAHLLAPAVFMGNVTIGIVTALAPYVGKPGLGATLLTSKQFLPGNPHLHRLLDAACGGHPTFPKYCELLFMLWTGRTQPNLNGTVLPQLAETHPAGSSTNQGIHFLQSYVSNRFRQFDHGVSKNMNKYNQQTPPDYPLEKITANTYIYYGLADGSANKKDIMRLHNYLPNIKLMHEVPNPTWGHLDFVLAWKVKSTINDPVIDACKQFEMSNNNKFYYNS